MKQQHKTSRSSQFWCIYSVDRSRLLEISDDGINFPRRWLQMGISSSKLISLRPKTLWLRCVQYS